MRLCQAFGGHRAPGPGDHQRRVGGAQEKGRQRGDLVVLTVG